MMSGSAVAAIRRPVASGNFVRKSALRLLALSLLLGSATIRSDSAPVALAAQIRTIDLSGSPVATVIPAEYDGGFFARIGDVLVNDSGIWVADVGHSRVSWFAADGTLRAEFGREGSGPGEWLSPGIVSVDSLLTVDDLPQGRRVRFRLDGSHLDTKSVPHFADPNGGEIPLVDAVSLAGGLTVGMLPGRYIVSFSRNFTYDLRHHVVLLNPGVESTDTLLSLHWGMAGWKTEVMGAAKSTHFGAAGAWSVLGDTAVVLADGVVGTLTIVNAESGSIRAETIDLGFAGRPVTDRDLEDLEEDIRAGVSLDIPREMDIDAPAYWSVATDLIAATDQVFWLRQAAEGEQEQWIIVEIETMLKWRVVLPERFRLKDVRGRLLYGVVRDHLDVPSVGVLVNPVDADPIPGPR